ncbi:MAG: DNA-directed RNA polymerase subunit beta' [Planctomycetota bacterium]
MIEQKQVRINDFSSVGIQLASPNDIRSWSYGEVKKPETINYRTYKPEKDGLFCERIFGPEKDWECGCGKYKGVKYKDIICDRCGVKVTASKVRRERFGHINLAAPVVHIWYFKVNPSRIAALLGIKNSDIQKIIYFQRYVVIDPGSTKLKNLQTLNEDEYRQYRSQYGEEFKAGIGAEVIRDLLQKVDIQSLKKELRGELTDSNAKSRLQQTIRRLQTVEALAGSTNSCEWMVLDVVPVIPPDLRPLVPLDSGNFATSDLNDLYRRVINRNNRLRKLLDLDAPSVIIRNEKRMLQQAVDALFDNQRCKRPVLGSAKRPLKSLTDMIKGKQGRFRENLLGKRVDYSARSVIVIGPDLRLDECGLPKKIALTLFQPFIIRKLKERGYADTIKSAKRMLENRAPEIWDVLDEVIQNHPVLLNRAPTLHRLGIQAFYPKLVEGDAITIHPLVCSGFNADFDGDTMSVHLPLSLEAQVEARVLMAATNNIFSPSNGSPLITPDLDIVFGCYFLTSEKHLWADAKGRLVSDEKPSADRHMVIDRDEVRKFAKAFATKEEVLLALDFDKVSRRDPIRLRLGEEWVLKGQDHVLVIGQDSGKRNVGDVILTTVGRVIFNDTIVDGMPFYNQPMDKGSLKRVVADCNQYHDRSITVDLLNRLKNMGFHEATLSGLSFAASDLKIPESKKTLITEAEQRVSRYQTAYEKGAITDGERYRHVVDIWTSVRDDVWSELVIALKNDLRASEPHYVNPIYFMTNSGARGSRAQVGQLAGMRGLMARPSGEIIEQPIKANFREGLRELEYFSSTHGARKGLADTALKTANSGYLTRKLVEVAQDVVITTHDCQTRNGLPKSAVYRGDNIEVCLADSLFGRTSRKPIVDILTGEKIIGENEIITMDKARRIEEYLGEGGKLLVRSPLTCEAENGCCALCYGMDLSTGRLVEEGMAVGIIAAQSVGEPGTQLTMRTFHIGGTASHVADESDVRARNAGTVHYREVRSVVNAQGERLNLSRNGELVIVDGKDREIEKHPLSVGAVIRIEDGQKVKKRDILAAWDPMTIPIISEVSGVVRYEEIIEGQTLEMEKDQITGTERKMISEHKGDLHPQVVIEDGAGKILAMYPVPEKATLEVEDGASIQSGQILAKTTRSIAGTQDITGGLPRVQELFEARKPKDPAILSEMDGVVDIQSKRKRGKRVVVIEDKDAGIKVEHLIPAGKHLLVRTGDYVREGDPLVDGPLIPHDILRISGDEPLFDYMLREVQNVYRLQNVRISDKHIEILVRQMLRRVKVTEPGDTEYLPSDTVEKVKLMKINEKLTAKGKQPASWEPLLLGIARASLQSDSWIAAASFQETTKVLTGAALKGASDPLLGPKENVILGHIIPAGTGFPDYYVGMLKPLVEPPVIVRPEPEEGDAVEQIGMKGEATLDGAD